MTLFNLIPILTGEREKETIQLIKDHSDKTYQVVNELKKAFSAFERREYETLKERVDNVCSIESHADDLRRRIEENMYSGAFLPGSRSLILNFAEMVDKIADAAQDAARTLIFLEDKKLPGDILSLVKTELDYGLDSVDILRKSISDLGNIAEIRSSIERIRVKEHESDEVANKAYALLYKKVKDAVGVLLMSKLVEYTGNISDRAEDATDELSLILLLQKA